MNDLIIRNPQEHKTEAQKCLKIGFDNIKLAHDTLLNHKLLDQEIANTFTKVAELILELGKKMNPEKKVTK